MAVVKRPAGPRIHGRTEEPGVGREGMVHSHRFKADDGTPDQVSATSSAIERLRSRIWDSEGISESDREVFLEFSDELEPFRRASYRERQPAFDRVLEHARSHAASAGVLNHPDIEKLALFSMCVGLQSTILRRPPGPGAPCYSPFGSPIEMSPASSP